MEEIERTFRACRVLEKATPQRSKRLSTLGRHVYASQAAAMFPRHGLRHGISLVERGVLRPVVLGPSGEDRSPSVSHPARLDLVADGLDRLAQALASCDPETHEASSPLRLGDSENLETTE